MGFRLNPVLYGERQGSGTRLNVQAARPASSALSMVPAARWAGDDEVDLPEISLKIHEYSCKCLTNVTPLWDAVFMLIEAARRIEATAKEVLALVNAGDASCEEMRQMLEVFKAAIAIMTVAQTVAAASIAGRERHGDGGAEVLASGAGLSRQEARNHVRTAETLRSTPRLRDAVESGRVPIANAKRLAEAAGKTTAR